MKKFFTFLFAALMSVASMWAQTETLLTTITATGIEQANYSTEGVATVSFSYTAEGSSAYLANWGWWGYGWSATVNAAEGYTITKCVFYDDANRTATDSEAPFVVETTEEDKTPQVNGTPIEEFTSKGIKKIDVYGYATPTTHTLRLVADSVMGSVAVTNLLGSDIVDNGDGTYTVPENARVTILATPNEGYEFSGWLEGNVLCDFIDCGTTLNTMDNPLTFTITQDAACKAEFVAVAPSAKYYVVGDMTNWAVNANYEMTPSNIRVDEVEEYKFDITLTTANQFKVVKVEGETQTWYPDGMGNNYGEHGEIERDGDYTIYFRPALDGDDDWFYNCIMAIRHATPERVVVAALFPENGKPTEGVKIFGSFSEEEFDMTLIIETGGYIHSEIMAADQDEFMFRDAADEENVLMVRNDAWEWVEAVFTFDEEWEQDTYKGEPVKMIDLDLTDNSKYAWSTDIPEGLEEVQSEKAESRKIMLNGMLYIVRDGKMYNVLGTEMK